MMLSGAVYRLVVASKYASLTPWEYHNFMTCKDGEIVHDLRAQMQLLSGWLTVDVPQCAHEARMAACRIGLCNEACAAGFCG